MLRDRDMLDVSGKRFLAALHAREAQCATPPPYRSQLVLAPLIFSRIYSLIFGYLYSTTLVNVPLPSIPFFLALSLSSTFRVVANAFNMAGVIHPTDPTACGR